MTLLRTAKRVLRDYQKRAVTRVFEEWEQVRSTLFVAATGAGKTTTFTEIISRMQPKRALVVAHREELIFQARERIEDQAMLDCEVEMADQVASVSEFMRTPVVAATIQTLNSRKRLERFNPNDFGLLVIDEAHHSTADSYRKIIDYFLKNPDLKVVGCTATPDRADEEALGQIFETVADVYEILDAIHDGWLVPVDQQMVEIAGLDFSNMRTTAGDLNNSDLAMVMESERVLQGVCGAAIEIIGNKRALVFTSSVRHAEMACDIFNRYFPNSAGWISGKTPKQDRRMIMRNFHSGALQILCNVGCLTEGVDVPAAEVVIMARPTKSRSLYAQMAGRILRPLPGLVDSLPDREARKKAICESLKPSALLVDFVGNSGRHKLITAADILGGRVSDGAVQFAIEIAKAAGAPVRVNKLLDDAEIEIRRKEEEKRKLEEAARKARLKATVSYTRKGVDPFNAFSIEPDRVRGWDTDKRLSEKQCSILRKQGIDYTNMPYAQAKQVINELFRRWKGGLATIKQCKVLKSFGYDPKDMTIKEASSILDTLAKNGWKK